MHTDKSNSEEKEDMIKSEKNGNLTIRRNKTVDFIAKIGCLIIAFFIWFYAVKNDTALYEEYFSSIPVDIVNQSGFSVLSGDDVTVDVTLSGKRSVINRISTSDIRAFIDMSSITSAGKYKFDVQYELPNGVSLVKSTSNSITVYADNTSSVSVPVITEITNFMLEDGYGAWTQRYHDRYSERYGYRTGIGNISDRICQNQCGYRSCHKNRNIQRKYFSR